MEIPGDCAEKFTPKKLLGEGGFGRVYLADQKGLSREVAIKVLRTETLHDETQKHRFLEEGRITAQLSHPNVVRVIDMGAATGVPWVVYELVDGPTLRDQAARHPLTWKEAIRAACSVASALEEAHRHEIFHRDVKAENVLQAANGEYKLADFGIAKWTQDTGVKTRTGFVVGTPTHLAPELIRGLSPSAASDVYALGVLLYELLTGRLPFDDEHLGKLMQAHLEQKVPTPTRFQPDLPDELNGILKKALEKDPGDRIATARELREKLERVQVNEESGRYKRRVLQAAQQEVEAAGQPAPRTGRNTQRSKVARPEPAPVAARSRAALAAWVFGVGMLAGLLVLMLKPRPEVHVVSSPSPVASPQVDLEAARARLNRMLVDIASAVHALGRRSEDLRRKAKREADLLVDLTVNTPEIAPLIIRGLEQYERAVDELEKRQERGLVWFLLMTSFDEIVRPMRDDPRGMTRLVGPRVERLVARARAAASDDSVMRAYAAHLSAAAQFARDEPRAQARLAAAYAESLQVLKDRPASDSTMMEPTRLRVRQVLAFQWLLNESHARDTKVHEALVTPLREIHAATRAGVAALSTPQKDQIAYELLYHALHGVTEAWPFVAKGLLPRAEVEAAARDTVALLAAHPPRPADPHVVGELERFRQLVTSEKLIMTDLRAPWEPR